MMWLMIRLMMRSPPTFTLSASQQLPPGFLQAVAGGATRNGIDADAYESRRPQSNSTRTSSANRASENTPAATQHSTPAWAAAAAASAAARRPETHMTAPPYGPLRSPAPPPAPPTAAAYAPAHLRTGPSAPQDRPCPHCGYPVPFVALEPLCSCPRCGTRFLNLPPDKMLLGVTVAARPPALAAAQQQVQHAGA